MLRKVKKLILDPHPDPDQQQTLITSSVTYFPCLGRRPLPRSWVILLTDRQTNERQTDSKDHTTPPWLSNDNNNITLRKEAGPPRLLVDFGVVNTEDDDCEQQIPTVALCLQQMTTPTVRQQSARLTTAAVWWQVEQETSWTYYVSETIPQGAFGEDLNAATESAMSTS